MAGILYIIEVLPVIFRGPYIFMDGNLRKDFIFVSSSLWNVFDESKMRGGKFHESHHEMYTFERNHIINATTLQSSIYVEI